VHLLIGEGIVPSAELHVLTAGCQQATRAHSSVGAFDVHPFELSEHCGVFDQSCG
jgi:hypothetical protein